jgi:flagellar FliJ protein
MIRFKFELEKVLELRKHREKETELALGKAVGVLNEVEMRIAAIDSERERMSKELPKSPSDIFSFDRYVLRLISTKTAYLKEKAEAEVKVEEARSIYQIANRDRKILDKIKERRMQEHHKLMLAEETKTIDDISSGIKARKLASGNDDTSAAS